MAEAGKIVKLVQAAFLFIIRLYRLVLSPWLGDACRFHPSCSHYAEDAIRQHGALKGSWLAIKRLGKCHPWHEGGLDPVPPQPLPEK
jgi:putative membrane protein insertion efficiency factor